MDVFQRAEILTFNEFTSPIFRSPKIHSLKVQRVHIENIGRVRSRLTLLAFGTMRWVRHPTDTDIWKVVSDGHRYRGGVSSVIYHDVPIPLAIMVSLDDGFDSDTSIEDSASDSGWSSNDDDSGFGVIEEETPRCMIM